MSPQRAAEIAQSFDLRDLPPDFYDDPYPVYAHLQAHEPVRRMPDSSLLVTRHADLVAVYRDAKTFGSDKRVEFTPKYGAGSPLLEHHTTSLVFNDAPAHTQVRRVLMGALTRRAIDAMEPGLHDLVGHLLDDLAARGGGDLVADYAAAIPVEVIGNLLGVPSDERAPLRGWSLAILGALEPKLSTEQLALGERAVVEFKSYLRTLIAERTRKPGDPAHDVLTRLIQAEQIAGGEPLSELALLHNCIFILNAGHETTTNLIANSLVAIAENASARSYLLSIIEQQMSSGCRQSADFSLNFPTQGMETGQGAWESAIDEFLRFESSNQLGNRRAATDFELAGVGYPAGTPLTLCIGAANRDPTVFDAPHVLKLARQPNRHLAFGLGPHQCAGLSLARLEGRIAVSSFLRRFPDFALTGAPQRSQRVRFRGFTSVPFVCASV
jgi:cytochrome P450